MAEAATFRPSQAAVGPNRYLGQRAFNFSIAVAAILHITVLTVFDILPDPPVTSIPVRALSLKIGGGEGAPGLQLSSGIPAIPPVAAAPSSPRVASAPRAAAPARASEPKRINVAQALASYQPALPAPTPKPTYTPAPVTPPAPAQSAAVSSTRAALAARPAIAMNPTAYVREGGDNGAPGDAKGLAGLPAAEMVARYEQIISRWLAKHKTYPPSARAGGQHGRGMVRLRIDRQGNVKFVAIDQSTAYPILDQAAIEMVRRANPLPSPPADYPGGSLIEFLVPVTYELD